MGDNEGLNLLEGVICCFTGNYCCRFCREHKNVRSYQCKENPASLRNRENYITDLEKNDPSQSGLNGDSIWNSLEFFHVTDNFSVDRMHDL